MTDNQGITPPHLRNLGNMTTTPQLKEEIVRFGDDIVVLEMLTVPGKIAKRGHYTVEERNLEIRRKADKLAKKLEAIITAQVSEAIRDRHNDMCNKLDKVKFDMAEPINKELSDQEVL